MDDVLANVSLERVGVVGLCIYAVVAFMRGWIVPGSRVGEVRAHYEAEIDRLTAGHETVVAFQTVALATERERADREQTLNLRLMGYVEAGLTAARLESGQEAP